MKYKVGDKVRIKSIAWYNENKSKSHGTVVCGGKYFDYDMREWCGKTMTIIAAHETCYSYIMKEDGRKHFWTDEMIEGLVEEEIPKKDTIVADKDIMQVLTYEEKIETILSILATPIWRRRLNDDTLNKLITEAYFEMKERNTKMEK